MLLEPRQRLLFMEWCKRQADSSNAIAEQIEKLPTPATAAIAKRERQKAAAFAIVALELASVTEEFTVSAEDVGDLPHG